MKKTSKILENRKALLALLFAFKTTHWPDFFRLREATSFGKLIYMGCMRELSKLRPGTTVEQAVLSQHGREQRDIQLGFLYMGTW